MNIGIFGGTFDPPHISHTLACLYVLETTDIERILVIPCFQHPFRKTAVAFSHRVDMCRIAMECLAPRVEVSEIEAGRKSPSYTIDTLKILKKHLPDAQFSLIIGSDILQETSKWKSFDEIERIARIIILPRPQREAEQKQSEEPHFLLPDISSSEIRRRLKTEEDVSTFLSHRVLEYISRHNLYRL